jgi:UDP-N-acetylmuramoyl-L-alanyl-D-glutamate--2,6-diaminopimelate ligase
MPSRPETAQAASGLGSIDFGPSIARPEPPSGPYVVAGLGRAGRAALGALRDLAEPGEIAIWDLVRPPEPGRERDKLRAMGAGDVKLGGPGVSLLERNPQLRCVVKSPGVPFTTPFMQYATGHGLEVIDEADLGWRLQPRPFVAVTGTNGKSTVAALALEVVRAGGAEPVLAGNTTFGPPLCECRHTEADVVVAEMSSFQLEGCPRLLPEAAVFTNLGDEHLRRHGTMQRYASCKRRLFVRGTSSVRRAAVNVDDPFGAELAAEIRERGGRVATYGIDPGAEYRVLGCEWTLDSAAIEIRTPRGTVHLDTRLPGWHNALNVAAALALSGALGIEPEAAHGAIASAAPVPGRFELIREARDFDVLVDFAHNPDGVRCVCGTARQVLERRGGGRLIAVLSTLASADEQLGRAIGTVAGSMTDDLVLTVGQQRKMSTVAESSPGLIEGARDSAESLEMVDDRRVGIRNALSRARPGDIVLILGRGSMNLPLYDKDGNAAPFDDRAEARALLGGDRPE